MRKLDLKIGFQCNNSCLFCVQGDKRKFFPNKSDEEIREILEGNAKSCQEVVFTGGEPTIREELISWVKYAKKLGYRNVQIQTNGRLFAYKDYCNKIIKAGATVFSPALHGSTAEIHDGLTQAPGSFKQTVQGIKNLKSLGQRVGTNSVITKVNYKDLPRLASLLVKLGVDQFQFAFIHINQIIAGNPELIDKIVPRFNKIEPYVKKGLRIGARAGITCMTEAIPYCFMKNYENFVAERIIPDADVFDAEFSIKNYNNYRKNKGKSKGPLCPKCKHFKICEGSWKEYPQIFGWDEFKLIQDKG